MSLLLDLGRLPAGATPVERREEPAAFGVPLNDFRITSPVDLLLEAVKDGRKIRLRGRMAARLEIACSRCLEPFELAVDQPVDALYLPAAQRLGDEDEEIADEDLGVSYYEEDVINLAELVREQCYLALPMKPLCREDCRGLCPVCGVNRNRETCACVTNWVDPRFDALRRLKDQ